ncbi:MAG: 4-(cytidine 5'-diphospho)-2-C-methyl-D-erythritol kinase [Pirellulales bacterium]
MLVRAATQSVEVWTPAKLNLFLEVLSKRADGFHEIETVMAPIDLHDTLILQPAAHGRIDLHCRWASPAAQPDAWRDIELPSGQRNIVVRALEMLREGHAPRAGATVTLIKRIPLAAGLAGGSSDAAAALVAANLVWRMGMKRQQLQSVAARLGSDVPFFLENSAAICRGRGEQIVPLPGLVPLHLAVAYPAASLATADVYKACQPAQPARRANDLQQAWQAGDAALVGRLLHNRLQPAAAQLSPWIERLRQEFARQDVLGAQMSGSGSSYFGLCRNARHARQVAERLRMRGLGHVYTCRTSCGFRC